MVWSTLQYDGCFDTFLADADKVVRAKTKGIIYRLRGKGRDAREPLVKKVKGFKDIFEVRTTGARQVRGVFFYSDKKQEIVFTSFHLKKKGKLQDSVFEQAERVKKAYDDGTERFNKFH